MSSRSFAIRYTAEILKLVANPKFMAPCVAGAFMLIVGTVLGVQYSFNMAAVLFALPIASYIMAVFSLRGVKITRPGVPAVVEGESVDLAVRVEISGMSPRLRLKIQDTLPPGIEMDYPEGLEFAICRPEPARIPYQVRAARRGVYTIGPLYLLSKDPIGIFECKRSFGQQAELVVYPRPHRIPLDKLFGSMGYQEEENESGGKKGQGLELHGVRDYAPGDPLRRIHWRTTARRGSFVVAEFEQAVAADVTMAIETGKGTDQPGKDGSSLDRAVRVAAFISDSVLSMGRPVRLLMGSGRNIGEHWARSMEDKDKVAYQLAKAKADSDLALSQVLESVDFLSGQSLVVITSALDQELCSRITGLLGAGVVVSLVLTALQETSRKYLEDMRSAGVRALLIEEGSDG